MKVKLALASLSVFCFSLASLSFADDIVKEPDIKAFKDNKCNTCHGAEISKHINSAHFVFNDFKNDIEVIRKEANVKKIKIEVQKPHKEGKPRKEDTTNSKKAHETTFRTTSSICAKCHMVKTK